jgi:hypothetical protein
MQASFHLLGKEVYVHASVGVAMTEGSQDPRTICSAKPTSRCTRPREQGKDRFEVFVPSMRDEVFDRLELKADLLRALEHEQFTPNSAT